MNRREFLALSTTAAISGMAGVSRAEEHAAAAARVTLAPGKILGSIPPDFMGLGYEISSVADSGLLSGKNRRMIQFVRTLGKAGVIRVGGNTSDDAHWSADGQPVSRPVGTVVNKAVIADLGHFLRATGWKVIWGLNLGRSTPAEVVAEARAVADSAGNSLLAFETGNEPDLFVPAHRKKGYGYSDYLREYRELKQAIRAAIPAAPFAGPDVAGATDWVGKFAKDEGADLKLLTHHHYSQGPPRNKTTTIENLLAGKTNLERKLDEISAAAGSAHLPYRFCEVNSCFGGGKAGVSDTFASALWVLDLMWTLASHNCAGVNIETGVNQLGRISDYSPIYPTGPNAYTARPIYYGMLAFARGCQGKRIGCDLDTGGLNLKAYAAVGEGGTTRLTLINKELSRHAKVRIVAGPNARTATICRLTAPSADSRVGVTLGGAAVNADGHWTAVLKERVEGREGKFDVDLPGASAAIVEFDAGKLGAG
ncbi:MAG TPA: glycosyl hydrolase family 79 C-terminal domain-containing protein [Tepidisphaeraceae bacterium]|nr:glycosyl hydrolase family 79 C-terminal domain-containing protein [Tepidisphaeraceae bacterium]